MRRIEVLVLGLMPMILLADVPGSKDPPGMKRYEGSELIAYRAPKFDEYLLPLAIPKEMYPPSYSKSMLVEGQISRYTYLAPEGRTGTELLRNYKNEFERLGLETMYEKKAAERGWFGPTFDKIAEEDHLGQILAYNEASERLLVGKTRSAKPAYYVVFVTEYKDGVIPPDLTSKITKGRAMAELIVISPDVMENKMVSMNADEMATSIRDTGKVALYGLYFDNDKDEVRADSRPTLEEIAKLIKSTPSRRIHVVGHTDNQGKPDYNLDLSRRRAASVVRELTTKFGITADKLDAFGCGLYSPVASNESEEGRSKNRRVELVQW
jgi:outer membrane protein OmpA-like peptidoglycan-associated protein